MTYSKNTIPAVPLIFVIGVLALAAIWLLRPKNVTIAAAETGTNVLESETLRVIVNDEDRTEELKAQAPRPYRYRDPAKLSLSDVDYIGSKGRQPVLVFTDGSQLAVSESVRRNLPGDVRLRIDYDRDD